MASYSVITIVAYICLSHKFMNKNILNSFSAYHMYMCLELTACDCITSQGSGPKGSLPLSEAIYYL